jgi:hypothetical protein
MIDSQALLRDLKRMVRDLEKDLREVHATSPQGRAIEVEWREAHSAGRTAHSLETFSTDALTQAAVHWVLACVFLRFIEDNGLVDRPWLAGPGERMALARDRHAGYFRRNPRDSDVDYLLACFDEAAALPGLGGLFDRAHNPLFRLPLSGDGAMALLAFLQKEDPDTGALGHDFTVAAWSTRFLGDLYQDLSEAARKRYALLQTPEFVERFILERTLDPAINELGLREVRLIDPACGSGHFLLGAFERICGLWVAREPGLNPRAAAQRALDAVAGVDINPFAAEIARFRLLLAALRASDIPRPSTSARCTRMRRCRPSIWRSRCSATRSGCARRWAMRPSSASSTKGQAATAAGARWKADGTRPASSRPCWSRPAVPSASASSPT